MPLPSYADPNQFSRMLAGIDSPGVDTTLTVKSPQGGAVTPPATQPGFLGDIWGSVSNFLSPDGKGPSPQLLGLISLLGNVGASLSATRDFPMQNQPGAIAGGYAKNALFNQFLQQMLAGGGGTQPTPPSNLGGA